VPSSDPVQHFRDIFRNIERIESHTVGLDCASFLDDHKAYDAVERRRERISEAATKLANVAEEMCPDIPWPEIRSLGNSCATNMIELKGNASGS
jgi:uncharacterized protein with HEPN domain